MKRLSVHCRGLFVLVALLSAIASNASTLVVTNNNDSGVGSLRQAIADNASAGGNNTILISNTVTGTIGLSTGELLIATNVTILGPGANILALNGNALSRVFHLNTNASVTLAGLTITNGRASGSSTAGTGAGIFSDHATLTVSNCTITHCIADGGGGGIYNLFGTLTVRNSTLYNNSASGGAGLAIAGGGPVSITSSTFSGNQASSLGGAIENSSATATIISSTIASNTAPSGGGIVVNPGSTFNFGDCIFANNTGGNNILVAGTVNSMGYNLSTDNDFNTFNATGDQINRAANISPLQDNGGPTPTHMPLTNSAAIDTGKNLSNLPTDQRGRYRVYDDPTRGNFFSGDASDIGAVESCPSSRGVVTTTADSGASLRWCINDAQPGDTITFSNGVTGTIYLTNGGSLAINNKNLTIQGPGPNLLAIDGTTYYLPFNIYNGSLVTLSGLTITNGNGGIANYLSTLTVSNCVIVGNTNNVGAGINNYGNSGTATTTAINTTFHNNSSDRGPGGAVYNYGFGGNATFKLVGCTFSGNFATNGSAVYNFAGDFSASGGTATTLITNCTVANNSCMGNGAIYNSGGAAGNATVVLIASTLSSNAVPVPFLTGGIYNSGATATTEIGNTILKASIGSNIFNAGGVIHSDGFNLSSDNTTNYLRFSGDQNNTDPLLGSLQDNGGPTQTIALLTNSPARDKGKSFGLLTDQRGAPRTIDFPNLTNALGGDGTDIGAFESGNPTMTIAPDPAGVVISWPSFYGGFTLESVAALPAANNWITAGSSTLVGSQYTVTNGVSGSKFYRLRGL